MSDDVLEILSGRKRKPAAAEPPSDEGTSSPARDFLAAISGAVHAAGDKLRGKRRETGTIATGGIRG
jgi:hypothetical protein